MLSGRCRKMATRPKILPVAAERSLIADRLTQYEGRVKRCDVILARTDELYW